MSKYVRSDSPSNDCESGYSSASNSEDSLDEVFFTGPHLKHINAALQRLEPEDILKWCLVTLPGLFQTTAFGLTGLVTLDMLSKLTSSSSSSRNNNNSTSSSTSSPPSSSVDMIFLDTLHHFPETLNLISRIRTRYPNVNLHIYTPKSTATSAEFSLLHGEKLWETDGDKYDYLVKVEPAQRAYSELKVKAVLTGRRRSQGGKRGDLDIVEVDEAGLIKVNPLANWSFKQVKEYIDRENVPYNELLDKGYKSVGDWHSTSPVKEGEDERSGRWKGQEKTECGIHNPRSKYFQYLQELERKKLEQELTETLGNVQIEGAAA